MLSLTYPGNNRMRHALRRVRTRWVSTVALVAGLVAGASSPSLLEVGYAPLTADAGRALAVGPALVSYTNSSGVLISQAGVGAAQPAAAGRIFVDEAGTRTGIALVNPSTRDASITLILRDSSGKEVERASRTLGA